MARRRTYGLSFSPSRALGIAGAKARLSRKIGVPLTQGGLERKVGRTVLRAVGWVLGLVVLAILAAVMR